MSAHIDIARDGAIATVTLANDGKLNAVTAQMWRDLKAAADVLSDDASLRCVIVCGAGEAFAAGGDIGEFAELRDTLARARLLHEQWVAPALAAVRDCLHPTIAAIRGPCIGGGLEIACACDIRIAAAGAKLAFPFAKLGIVPGLGSSFLLPRLLGPGQAKILALTGQTISAEEALAIGLVDRVVAPESLLAETLELARAIAANSPQIDGLIKEALNAGATATSIDAALAFEHAQNARRSKILS